MDKSRHTLCPTTTCNRCHKRFNPGDRVVIANVIEKVGRNPSDIMQEGSWLSGEFEMSHLMCDNPAMSHSIVLSS
jgi:hypothetical protein